MLAFLRLIRIENLVVIAIMQLLLKYALFVPFDLGMALPDLQYILLVLASISIAAAGYIINDIYDAPIDAVNRPKKQIIGKKITEKTAYNYYIFWNVLGVGTGFYLANYIGKPSLAAVFIVLSVLLYLYASYLKTVLLAGNILVALLVATSILVCGIFDLYPAITEANRVGQSTVFSIVLDYALFAFVLTILREIVKDIQDINGDKKGGVYSIPIAIGRKRASLVAFVWNIGVLALVVYYVYTYLYQQQIAMLYFLFAIIAPLLYFAIRILMAEKQQDYAKLSALLKIVMLTGVLSLLLYPFILQ